MSCVSLATPGTEACDAVGGALRPQWRERPGLVLGQVLSERIVFGMPLAALFAFFLSCSSSDKLVVGYFDQSPATSGSRFI
jgi:hypothetical protein